MRSGDAGGEHAPIVVLRTTSGLDPVPSGDGRSGWRRPEPGERSYAVFEPALNKLGGCQVVGGAGLASLELGRSQ